VLRSADGRDVALVAQIVSASASSGSYCRSMRSHRSWGAVVVTVYCAPAWSIRRMTVNVAPFARVRSRALRTRDSRSLSHTQDAARRVNTSPSGRAGELVSARLEWHRQIERFARLRRCTGAPGHVELGRR